MSSSPITKLIIGIFIFIALAIFYNMSIGLFYTLGYQSNCKESFSEITNICRINSFN